MTSPLSKPLSIVTVRELVVLRWLAQGARLVKVHGLSKLQVVVGETDRPFSPAMVQRGLVERLRTLDMIALAPLTYEFHITDRGRELVARAERKRAAA